MIAYISGRIIKREAQAIIIQAEAIGYRVYVPDEHMFSSDQVHAWIYTHWSQEQGVTLYGFSTEHQLEAFALLLEAQGVGPRLALQCLAHLTASSVIGALAQGDIKTLSSVPGIGHQKAKKITFHLHDKAREAAQRIEVSDNAHVKVMQDVRAAMTSLGYKHHEVENALTHIDISDDDRFDTILRKALARLAQ